MFGEKMIFVIGVGRSGTTLVQAMLNAHPRIKFPPETHFFRRYIANGKAKEYYESYGLEKFISLISDDPYIHRLGIDIDFLIRQRIDPGKGFSPEDLYIKLLMDSISLKESQLLGDKDPRAIEVLPSLKKSFPNSYIVHVIRDPRDTIVSRFKAEWSSGRLFIHHLFVYNAQIRMGINWGKEKFGAKYVQVKYEDILGNPKKTLNKICESFEINFHENMLEFGKSANEIISVDERSWKKEVFGPLLKNNKNKWHGVLKNWQVALTESVCRDLMVKFGYTFSGRRSFVSDILSLPFRIGGKAYKEWCFLQQEK